MQRSVLLAWTGVIALLVLPRPGLREPQAPDVVPPLWHFEAGG